MLLNVVADNNGAMRSMVNNTARELTTSRYRPSRRFEILPGTRPSLVATHWTAAERRVGRDLLRYAKDRTERAWEHSRY